MTTYMYVHENANADKLRVIALFQIEVVLNLMPESRLLFWFTEYFDIVKPDLIFYFKLRCLNESSDNLPSSMHNHLMTR